MPLHNIHSPKDHSTGQDGVGDLVEDRVLGHVIVDRNPQGQGDEPYGYQSLGGFGPPVGEGRVGHDAGGINHGQLVGELHRVYGKQAVSRTTTERVGTKRDNQHNRVAWKAMEPRPTTM